MGVLERRELAEPRGHAGLERRDQQPQGPRDDLVGPGRRRERPDRMDAALDWRRPAALLRPRADGQRLLHDAARRVGDADGHPAVPVLRRHLDSRRRRSPSPCRRRPRSSSSRSARRRRRVGHVSSGARPRSSTTSASTSTAGLRRRAPGRGSTPSLIPGLGSSPTGRATPGSTRGSRTASRYFYRLEDVDASSMATSHGPVSAVPDGGVGARGADGRRQGREREARGLGLAVRAGSLVGPRRPRRGCDGAPRPAAARATAIPRRRRSSVVSRDARSATLELRTPGFCALHTQSGAGEPSGSVRVFVPGFDFPQDEQARGAAAAARPGGGRRRAGGSTLGGVRATDLAASAASCPPRWAGRDGGRPRRHRARGRAARPAAGSRGSFPRSEVARLCRASSRARRRARSSRSRRCATTPRAGSWCSRGGCRCGSIRRPRGRARAAGASGAARPGRADARLGEVLAHLHTGEARAPRGGLRAALPGRPRGFARLGAAPASARARRSPSTSSRARTSSAPAAVSTSSPTRRAASTAFSSEVAYELVRSTDGVRMALAPGAPRGTARRAGLATRLRVLRDQPLLPAGSARRARPVAVGGRRVGGDARRRPFALAGVDAAGRRGAGSSSTCRAARSRGQPSTTTCSVSLNGVLAGRGAVRGQAAVPRRA